MDFQTKRDQIKRMLKFIDYTGQEQLLMQEMRLEDNSWASCDYNGNFFSNRFMSRKSLVNPSENAVNYAYNILTIECNSKLTCLSSKCAFPFLIHILKKFYKLDFLT